MKIKKLIEKIIENPLYIKISLRDQILKDFKLFPYEGIILGILSLLLIFVVIGFLFGYFVIGFFLNGLL